MGLDQHGARGVMHLNSCPENQGLRAPQLLGSGILSHSLDGQIYLGANHVPLLDFHISFPRV